MKSHNKEKHVNIDDLSQPQLIMQHFRNYDLDKNGKIDGLELLKAALIMNGKDLKFKKNPPNSQLQPQNINKNSNADWSVWNLRGKTFKTKKN